ncbi:unnamed protein product, partial [Candidula unifasciata]
MAVSFTSEPSYWTHKSSQGYFLEDVPGTKATLIGIIKSTWDPRVVGAGQDAAKLKHSGVEIIEVKRVENASLFHSYNNKKHEFEKRGRPCPAIENIPQELAAFNKTRRSQAVNEYYLFHGTDEAINISKTGFQTRFADPDNLFGKGIYFSDSFQKADQYTDADNLKRLPCLLHRGSCACGPQQQRFDSVESAGLLFREFAVFEGRQCYPEYIVTYKRTGIQSW